MAVKNDFSVFIERDYIVNPVEHNELYWKTVKEFIGKYIEF